MVDYNELENRIAEQQDYKHGSSHGINENGSYKVYSYNTLILEIVDNKVKMFNKGYYSRTTSRLQNIIKKYYEV